ncbi:vWA domain-containing protein [Isoptericola croceus]|uniref:vWA domain-containing protein n=1 Tax=Isoptericola croceus TaxID=3031406 RepID=UPI0023F72D49|nr:VWA-like domain-containing protein [Isoptericola croceus]
MTDEQSASLQVWRYLAMEKMPYMAGLLFSLRVLDAPGLGTLAVDAGLRLYIDFDAIADRSDDERAQMLLHEVGHLFADHHLLAEELGVDQRTKGRAINVSADASLNDDLRDAGCEIFADDGGFILPSVLGEPDYKTPHHYYRSLTDDDEGQDGGDGGDGGEYTGCGSGSGSEPAPCELGDDDAGGTAPAASRVQVEVAGAIIEHAKNRGRVPAGLAERTEQILAPSTTPWQKILASMVRRGAASRAGTLDVDTSRRSRRRHDARLGGTGRRLVVPGMHTPVPRVALVRDTSGSMSAGDLNAVTNEVEAISQRVGIRGMDLRVIDVDADVAAERGYRRASDLAVRHGGGGTDMRVGIDAALQVRPRPSVVVVATDGYTPWPEEPVGVALVCVIVGTDDQRPRAISTAPSWAKVVEVATS